ncbi:ABC transporter substrate-binding protein [Belnapia sp. T18]|uniref:ABC transporter substrate-binding protein n=1 Tax=Belnapia arida TaxID=2804533 RepID=A0ABS1U669_9PROT|nr:ABC transporter substrate-binding protein [Belnapia arida]MBL6080055.1 ABC transporter substrate-binding protein [Belnapia arida]
MFRRSLGALGAATLVARPARSHAPATTRRPGERVLRVVAPFEFAGPDPARSGHVFARMGVGEMLLGADPEGRPVPMLAECWSTSPNGLLHRFVLRPGVRFHDGSPLTAEAAAESLRHAHAAASPFSRVPVAAIEATSDAVLIRLSRPFAPLPAVLANYASMILAPAAYDEAGRVRAVIGTGPFRVERFSPPLQLDVERFEGWWGPRPAIGRASYLVVSQGEARATMAESGHADLTMALQPVTVARLRRSPRLEVLTVPVPRTRILKLNAASPYFADQRVRQALSLAIDRQGIAAALVRNPAMAADQLFPPTLQDWHLPAPPPRRDLERARTLLAEAGWRPGQDGILVDAGRRRFACRCITYINWPELPPIATALQAQFRELGIDMSVAIGNSSDIPRGHRDGTLEMALMARNYALVPDPLATLLQDFQPGGGDWGAMGWSDPALDAALHALSAPAGDPTAARRQAAGILREALPVIPIAWSELGVAVSRDLAGVTVDPFETSYRLHDIAWLR